MEKTGEPVSTQHSDPLLQTLKLKQKNPDQKG